MDVPTSTGDTDTGDATDGPPPQCGEITEEPACRTTDGCLWDDISGLCVSDCAGIDNEAECEVAAYWGDVTGGS